MSRRYSVFAAGTTALSLPFQSTDVMLVTRAGLTYRIAPSSVRMIGSVTYVSPLTGATITATAGQGAFVIIPAAAIAALTVVLPPVTEDETIFEVSTTEDITTVTVTADTGESIYGTQGTLGTLGAGGGFSFRFRLANTTWYRRYLWLLAAFLSALWSQGAMAQTRLSGPWTASTGLSVSGSTVTAFPSAGVTAACADLSNDGEGCSSATRSANTVLSGPTSGAAAAPAFRALVAADIPVTPLAAGTSVSLAAPRQYYICTSTCTVTPPVPAAGYEFCVANDNNVATVITLAALGSSAMYENTARTAYGTAGTGTFVSGGAVGDKVCIVGRDSTHYLTATFQGAWTAN